MNSNSDTAAVETDEINDVSHIVNDFIVSILKLVADMVILGCHVVKSQML
jgi:hypothetical protein